MHAFGRKCTRAGRFSRLAIMVSCCAGFAFGVDAAVLGIHDGTEGARGLNIRLIY